MHIGRMVIFCMHWTTLSFPVYTPPPHSRNKFFKIEKNENVSVIIRQLYKYRKLVQPKSNFENTRDFHCQFIYSVSVRCINISMLIERSIKKFYGLVYNVYLYQSL